MDYNIVVIIAVVWIIINFLHILMKLWIPYEYSSFLQTLGLTLKPFKITLNITSLNRIIYIIGNWRPKLINKWFAFGTVVSISLIAPSIYIIISTIYNFLLVSGNDLNAPKSNLLYPVIPGINLPISDFLYYFISLAICGFYHEFGHALAAVREGVRIYNFGIFVIIIIPGASVDLSTEHVFNLQVWNQLKIYTAGVWHNIILSVFAMALITLNPLLLSPFYTQHEGAVLASIEPISIAYGPNGLRNADLITGLNNCIVTNESKWKHCLSLIANRPLIGYCVNSDFIEKKRVFNLDSNKCCDDNNQNSLCFIKESSTDTMCLPVRLLLENSFSTCNTSAECSQMFDSKHFCLKPVPDYNYTKLIEIKRRGKPSVLFWGTPSELFQSTILINYKPKLKWLPLITIFYYETLLKYIISFSLALAVLNIIPCVYLDGQWIMYAFIELMLSTRVSKRKKKIVSNTIISIGTVLLSSCVLLVLNQSYFNQTYVIHIIDSTDNIMEASDSEIYRPMTGMVYIFNLIVGTGALTMPRAVANSGWIVGLVVIITLSAISFITTTFVIESMCLANAIIKYRKSKQNDNDSEPERENEQKMPNAGNSSVNSDEKLPFMQCSTDDDSESILELFEISERIELGAMAKMFFSSIGLKLFYTCIIVYLFGDLSIYAAAIAKSLRDVTCDYQPKQCNQTLNLEDNCWTNIESVSRKSAYRIYLMVTLLFVGPFAFFNVQKTKYLQILTTILRWIAFVSMIAISSIILITGKGSGKPKSIDLNGIPNLFGVCVYAFMCHHSLPALITPIRRKKKLFTLIFTDYCLILAFYCLLSFTGIYAFSDIKDIYTLNFQVKCSNPNEDISISQVPFLDYFLPLFPVFTLSTNFPIIAITLQNNLKTLIAQNDTIANSSFSIKTLLYPMIAVCLPFIVAFITEDLEVLVGIVGSYAGATIQYIIPALLVFYSRATIAKTYPILVGRDVQTLSPFSHKIWIFLVMIWSVICLIFVTANHIIQFKY